MDFTKYFGKAVKCDDCGKELKGAVLYEGENEKLYCAECASRQDVRIYRYYKDENASVGNLLLDDNSYSKIISDYAEPVVSTSVSLCHGKPKTINDDLRGVYIIEVLRDDDDDRNKDYTSPQKTLIASEREIERLTSMFSRTMDRKNIMVKDSRIYDCTYIFIKGGDPEQTIRSLTELGEQLAKMNIGDRTVYAERMSGDKKNFTLATLAKSGLNCCFFDGLDIETGPEDPEEKNRLFQLGFTYNEFLDHMKSHVIGQDKEIEIAVYMIMDYLNKVSLGRKNNVSSIVLTAPSGCGKSEFAKVATEFLYSHKLRIPIIREDLSQITETGFKGRNVANIVDDLNSKTSKRYNSAAICFFDELDKKCIPSFSGNKTNVNAAVQGNLLSLIEGLPTKNSDDEVFDASNTLFIFMGSFQEARVLRKKQDDLINSIYNSFDEKTELTEGIHKDITLNDMIEVGMINEFAGRIKSIINFHKLDEESMRKIVRQKCGMVSTDCGCRIEMTPKAEDEFYNLANSDHGVRDVINTLYDIVIRKLSELASAPDFNIKDINLVIESRSLVTVKKAA